MKVSVRLNGIISLRCGWREKDLILEEGASVADLKKSIEDSSQDFEFAPLHANVAINQKLASEASKLNDGDFVTFLPPIAGG